VLMVANNHMLISRSSLAKYDTETEKELAWTGTLQESGESPGVGYPSFPNIQNPKKMKRNSK